MSDPRAELTPVASLKPHPRNYRTHPDDQIGHIVQSIKDHGLYRNVVVARDMTILAGHGVVAAAKKLGIEKVPVVRLDLAPNDPKALKLLAGDNEIGRLAEVDDRGLTDMLKELKDVDDLLGTGFDEMQLAALVMVTRPQSEIRDRDEAAQWVGMPEYDTGGQGYRITICFASKEERDKFVTETGLAVARESGNQVTAFWGAKPGREDIAAVRFEPKP